jgi:hypothetical protein
MPRLPLTFLCEAKITDPTNGRRPSLLPTPPSPHPTPGPYTEPPEVGHRLHDALQEKLPQELKEKFGVIVTVEYKELREGCLIALFAVTLLAVHQAPGFLEFLATIREVHDAVRWIAEQAEHVLRIALGPTPGGNNYNVAVTVPNESLLEDPASTHTWDPPDEPPPPPKAQMDPDRAAIGFLLTVAALVFLFALFLLIGRTRAVEAATPQGRAEPVSLGRAPVAPPALTEGPPILVPSRARVVRAAPDGARSAGRDGKASSEALVATRVPVVGCCRSQASNTERKNSSGGEPLRERRSSDA